MHIDKFKSVQRNLTENSQSSSKRKNNRPLAPYFDF